MYALATSPVDMGNVHETFFYSQTKVKNDATSSKISDFCIGDCTFEVGGRKKSGRQLAGASREIVVHDDIEYGHGDIVPLWAFGLNY